MSQQPYQLIKDVTPVLSRSELLVSTAQPLSTELFASYIDYIDASDKTIQTYTRALRQFYHYLKEQGIDRPSRETILAYRDSLSDIDPETNKPKYKATTIQNYITAVKLFFSWLAQEGIYPNVAEKIKGAKISKSHKKDYMTTNQVKDVLQGIDTSDENGLRDFALFSLAITTGMRTIELHRANIEDIRPRGNTSVLYVQGKGKEAKDDFVKLQAPVEKAIRDYLKVRGATDQTEPLFTSTSNNSKGKRLSTRSISGDIKRMMQEAGLDSDRLTAHSTRHTAITLALLQGKDLSEVQEFARHEHITTTQIYDHSLDKDRNDVGEVISKVIFG